MLKLPSVLRSRNALVTLLGVVLIAGTTAVVAQTAPLEPVQWDKRRLDQLDRNVRRLERAVTQRNAAGQPVIIEPDPEVVALQGRVGLMDRRLSDMEATVQRVNGDIERLTFQLDEATRDNGALGTRLRDAEGRIRAMEAAAAREAELNAPIPTTSPTGDAARDLTAAARLAAGDPARGDRALQTVIAAWPDTPQAREASSRLGDLRVSAGDHAGAVSAYATALQGWPAAPWAPATTLELANALNATDRKTQACTALTEFTRRYAEAASPAVRARAAETRTRLGCAAAPAPARRPG
ncbi:tol-pal system YbgF family protein [Brevundimonas sp.]|uniref:tetratricopeptide repeat protein n=1 Tax=Brevundimonas sp. TaxID=1871086 RepID=UPI002737A9D6|nr:tetratricopeptide repeat protein [Brevundimonas sp.]MDP3803381.1 tol-pal system protein [Brevundimonas sp.]